MNIIWRRNNMKRIYSILLATGIGCIVGMLTVIGQKYLPNDLNSLANSGAIWLIPAFYTAYLLRKELWYTIVIC